jgi:hypothetical protein
MKPEHDQLYGGILSQRSGKMADDPFEFGRKLAEQTPPHPERWALDAAPFTVLGEVLALLVEKNVLNEGDVIARLESTMMQIGKQPGAAYAVAMIQALRDRVANELDRKPS